MGRVVRISLRASAAVRIPISISREKRSRQIIPLHVWTISNVRALAEHCLKGSVNGIVPEQTRRYLQAIDKSVQFAPQALLHFQKLLGQVGIATTRAVELPVDDLPFWHREPNPFANYQSTRVLPSTADIVIIGAGLTAPLQPTIYVTARKQSSLSSKATLRAKPAAATAAISNCFRKIL